MNSNDFKIDFDYFYENEIEKTALSYKDISFINKTLKNCEYPFVISDESKRDIITIVINDLMHIEIFKKDEVYFFAVTSVLNATKGDNLDEFVYYEVEHLESFLPALIDSDDFQSFFFLNETPDKVNQKLLENYVNDLIDRDNVEMLAKLSGLIRY